MATGGQMKELGTGPGWGLFPAGTGACPAPRVTPLPLLLSVPPEESPRPCTGKVSSPPEDRPCPPLSPLASRSPRVPVAAHLAPAGARAEGQGGLHSPGRLRAALCSEGLAPPVAGVSAAGRGLRAQFPGAERGATATGGGFLRCCLSSSPPSSLSHLGLSALVAFWVPSPSNPRVSGSTRSPIHAHVLRRPTCSLHAWV